MEKPKSAPGRDVPVTGIFQTVGTALTHPVLSFKYQPGKFKGKVVKGKHKLERPFVKNPHFPDGIDVSFPAWYSLIVGIVGVAGAAVLIGLTFDSLGLVIPDRFKSERLKAFLEDPFDRKLSEEEAGELLDELGVPDFLRF